MQRTDSQGCSPTGMKAFLPVYVHLLNSCPQGPDEGQQDVMSGRRKLCLATPTPGSPEPRILPFFPI